MMLKSFQSLFLTFKLSLVFVGYIHFQGGCVEATCERVFLSTSDHRNGSFEAPERASKRPFVIRRNEQGNLTLTTNVMQDQLEPVHCIYKFIASQDEKVMLNFSSFRLHGDEPDCSSEYLDIFVKFQPDDKLEDRMGSEPPNGRFCTSIMPRRIVSLHNMVVLNIYSDLEHIDDRRPMFTGTYKFIRGNLNSQLGPSEPYSLCRHTIHSSEKREGEFQSITYPGVYVKDLHCSYKFVGEPGQRIRLEFLDLDLYSGGSHCPLDSVKIFDGSEETDPIINTICGGHRSWIIFSTGENLLVVFSTFKRESEIQNRGFSAYFEFSDKFVDPNFIQGPYSKHIRGSECDQRIVSHRSTKGYITSPDPKHHSNAICRYIFDGLQTSLDYEKVMLKFTEFDLKTGRLGQQQPQSSTATITTTTVGPEPTSTSQNATTDQCNDNYVRIYTGEQKPDQKQDPNDYDYVFCSNEVPQSIESDAASLLMEYNSGTIGGYFKAEYTFIVDFRIPGTQASTGCNYIYRSESAKTGIFNSPRYPSWYISDMNCSYTFMTKPDEALLLQFSNFKMWNSFNEKVIGYGDACKGEDTVDMMELSFEFSSNEQRVTDQTEIGSYCGVTAPGPLLSFKPVRVNFRTNKELTSYGFSGIYNFYPIQNLKTNEFVTNCGGQIYASQRLKTGTISSPETYRQETYEKRNHACSWNITARPGHKIALDFTRFELEGSPMVRGCTSAAVRLFTNSTRILAELCGSMSPSSGNPHQYISESEWFSMTFVSTKLASGSSGFTATWTELKSIG